MEYRRLGRTDIEVSTVCMGCWAIAGGGTWGDQVEADAMAAIHASLDAGVNFFDTAEAYGSGSSEELLAKGLAGRRDKAVIATKVGPGHLMPADIRASCESSLKRLRTDVIDLYQIHWPNWSVPMADSLGELDRLRSEGKIRAYGVSNFGPRDLAEALSHGRIESNQVAYSLLWRAIEFEARATCIRNDVAVLCYSSLGMGLLTGKYRSPADVPEGRARTRLFSSDRDGVRHADPGCEAEVFAALQGIRAISDSLGQPMGRVALGWLLAQPGVTSVLAGSRNAEQARANASAADLALSEDVLRQLSQITETVKARLGPNMDPWQSKPRIR